jgi:hypothetical protein
MFDTEIWARAVKTIDISNRAQIPISFKYVAIIFNSSVSLFSNRINQGMMKNIKRLS